MKAAVERLERGSASGSGRGGKAARNGQEDPRERVIVAVLYDTVLEVVTRGKGTEMDDDDFSGLVAYSPKVDRCLDVESRDFERGVFERDKRWLRKEA